MGFHSLDLAIWRRSVSLLGENTEYYQPTQKLIPEISAEVLSQPAQEMGVFALYPGLTVFSYSFCQGWAGGKVCFGEAGTCFPVASSHWSRLPANGQDDKVSL